MNLTKVYYKMDIIFMDSKNRKTSKLHRILLNFSDKINLNKSNKI